MGRVELVELVVVQEELVVQVGAQVEQVVEQGLVQVVREAQEAQENLHQLPFQVILQNDAKVSCILHSNLPNHLTKLAKHNLARNSKLAVHI
jgi:ribonucleotide reductase beta subunit family protein with ferritin-like domain